LCACAKDVEVVFELPDGSWSTKAEFSPSDIHRKVITRLLWFEWLLEYLCY